MVEYEIANIGSENRELKRQKTESWNFGRGQRLCFVTYLQEDGVVYVSFHDTNLGTMHGNSFLRSGDFNAYTVFGKDKGDWETFSADLEGLPEHVRERLVASTDPGREQRSSDLLHDYQRQKMLMASFRDYEHSENIFIKKYS